MKQKIRIIMLIAGLLLNCAGSVAANETKKLYFTEKNGTMTWDPIQTNGEQWFMDFVNMVPGGRYEEDLQIANESKKTYKLYVQAIPLEQDARKDQLLEQIFMKVLLDETELYHGTASGKEYENGTLQNVMYLGTYGPGEQAQIHVLLELNKELGMEYNHERTKNDWKFMVTEVQKTEGKESGTPVKVIQPPKTGDTANLRFYQMLATAALLCMCFLLVFRKISVKAAVEEGKEKYMA